MAGFKGVFNLHNPPPKCFTSLRYQVILSPICFMSKGKLIVETLIDLLRAVRAFRNLPVSALTKIAQIASPPTTYQAGELISDGQGEQALLLVVAGKGKVSLLTADGNENILYLLKGGDVDGQAALFVRQPRLARLAELEVDNSHLHLLDAKERLYAYLLDWERDYQSSTYQLAMTKGEVANRLGITPATLSRCLKQLVAEGKISVRGRQITIHHGAL
ncbi:helix-turn-helix domain-containing protein [Lactobacillus fermentum]|nr:helix-turn-helix domain-containing protein [Limosilactobacillus fermentum]